MNEPATILVVEDDEMIRLAVANGLRLDGHPVVEAATLAEAREGLGAQEVHLVLLDVELPDGSGLTHSARDEIERGFLEASRDSTKIQALGTTLQHYGAFERYEERFFSLINSSRR